MGYLTPVLIRNDHAEGLRDPKMQFQICEKLYKAILDHNPQDISYHYPMGGRVSGAIESLGTAHADADRVIVVFGNTWIDLTALEPRTDKVYMDYVDSCIRIAEQRIKSLKRELKKREE